MSVEDLGAHVAGVVAAAKGRKRKRLDQGVPKEGGEGRWVNGVLLWDKRYFKMDAKWSVYWGGYLG